MKIIDERGEEYGPASVNFKRTADLWSAFLGVPITPEQFAVCMALVKVGRMAHKFKSDNYLDARGYLHLAEQLSEGHAYNE